jgi:hypothetical protein
MANLKLKYEAVLSLLLTAEPGRDENNNIMYSRIHIYGTVSTIRHLNLPVLVIKICLVFKNMSESQKCYGEITSTSFNAEFICNNIVVKAVLMSIHNYKYHFQVCLRHFPTL